MAQETVRLRVVSEYRAGERYYPAGALIEVPAEEGAWLRRDAPGCFEETQNIASVLEEGSGAPGSQDKAVERPAADKMVRRPERKK